MLSIAKTLAIGAAAGYLVILALLYAFQGRLIHQPQTPARAITATPSEIGAAWETVAIDTSDGIRLHGWYLPGEDDSRQTLLFFHGNAGNIGARLETLELFHELGVATLIIDYRGYGQSQGQPSEKGLYRDAEAAWRYLVDARGIPSERIVAFGRSLGAAMASRLAAEHRVGGLVVESAFTSIPELGAEHYPIFPVRWLARFQYPTRDFVQRARAPVLVIHSPDDEIVPYHHGRALYQAAPQPKHFLAINGGHNTGYLTSQERYLSGLAGFLRGLP